MRHVFNSSVLKRGWVAIPFLDYAFELYLRNTYTREMNSRKFYLDKLYSHGL